MGHCDDGRSEWALGFVYEEKVVKKEIFFILIMIWLQKYYPIPSGIRKLMQFMVLLDLILVKKELDILQQFL